MDKLEQMKVFAGVADAGNLTRAADLFGITKSRVTRIIQELEADYRTKLLNRTTRKVSLTDAGRTYYARAKRILSEFDQIEDELVGDAGEPKGVLRVNVSVSVATMALIPALTGFQNQYPGIRLELGVTDRRTDLAGDGVDYMIRAGEVTQPSLVSRRIGELAFTTCASPRYLRRYGMPSSPEQLETTHPVVGYFSESSGRHYPFDFARGAERVELHGNRALSVSDTNALMAAALADIGVVQVPTITVRPLIEEGRLVPVLPDWECEPVPVSIAYLPHRHLGPKHRAFVDWVASLLAASAPRRPSPVSDIGVRPPVRRVARPTELALAA